MSGLHGGVLDSSGGHVLPVALGEESEEKSADSGDGDVLRNGRGVGDRCPETLKRVEVVDTVNEGFRGGEVIDEDPGQLGILEKSSHQPIGFGRLGDVTFDPPAGELATPVGEPACRQRADGELDQDATAGSDGFGCQSMCLVAHPIPMRVVQRADHADGISQFVESLRHPGQSFAVDSEPFHGGSPTSQSRNSATRRRSTSRAIIETRCRRCWIRLRSWSTRSAVGPRHVSSLLIRRAASSSCSITSRVR